MKLKARVYDSGSLRKTDPYIYKIIETIKKYPLPLKSTIRCAETHVTCSLVDYLKFDKRYKKGIHRNEVHYSEINPVFKSNFRLDVCSFSNGKFHFLEYKHHYQDRGGDSSLAILRGVIRDIYKLEKLIVSDDLYVNFKNHRFTSCCYIEEEEAKSNIDKDEDFSVSKFAIKKWYKDITQDNTLNNLGKIRSKINALDRKRSTIPIF